MGFLYFVDRWQELWGLKPPVAKALNNPTPTNRGATGPVGPPGSTGLSGATGLTGATGLRGNYGGYSDSWSFSTTLGGTLASGRMTFDSATSALVTEIKISYYDLSSVNVYSLLTNLQIGDRIRVFGLNGTDFWDGVVSGGWVDSPILEFVLLTVTHIVSSSVAVPFTNAEAVALTVSPIGSTGAAGATGLTGPIAGTDKQVIYNDAAAAGADAGFTYDKTVNMLSLNRASGPVYLKFNEASQNGTVAVGILGAPEANLSYNMDYADRVHRLYDNTKGASWLALNQTNWGVQYAPASATGSDVWYAGGGLLSIVGKHARSQVMLGYNSTIYAADNPDARLSIIRESAMPSIGGHGDLVIEGDRVKGATGTIFLNSYNSGPVVLTEGGGNVAIKAVGYDPPDALTIGSLGKIGWEISANTIDTEVGRDKADSLSMASGDQFWADNLCRIARQDVVDCFYQTVSDPSLIKALWMFNSTTAIATVADFSPNNHTLNLSANASTLTPDVTGLGRHLIINGPTSYYDTVDADDFSVAVGTPFTIVWHGSLTDATSSVLLGKMDVTTGSVKTEWIFRTLSTDKLIAVVYSNSSSAGYIARSYNTAITGDQGAFHTYIMTYDGGLVNTGIKIYRDGVQIDDTNLSSGSFTTITNTTAKVGSYYIGADGTTKTEPLKGRPMCCSFIKGEALNPVQVKVISDALSSYGGTTPAQYAATGYAKGWHSDGAGNLTAASVTAPLTTSGITLNENASIALTPALSADGKYNGITRTGTAGATIAFGNLVYLDPTASKWKLADANSAAAAAGDPRGILGICVLAAAADGSSTTVLLYGSVRADAAFPTFTVNAPIYVSETAGAVVVAQPTTLDVVIRVVGFGLTGDEMFFCPSPDYITHT